MSNFYFISAFIYPDRILFDSTWWISLAFTPYLFRGTVVVSRRRRVLRSQTDTSCQANDPNRAAVLDRLTAQC